MEQVSSAAQAQAHAIPQEQVYTAPADTGDVQLGRTLVSLLDEVCEYYPNPKALNQRTEAGWVALSSHDFRSRSQHLALGLLELNLQRGDRVGLYTHSDVSFCLGDMACLTAGLVDVPIYLTHPADAIKHILNEAECRVLICSDETLLADIAPHLPDTGVDTVVLWAEPDATLDLPGIALHTFAELETTGERLLAETPDRLEMLRAQTSADDVATLIYTSGTTGKPKGVVLTHENISMNAVASITGLTGFEPGEEVALSFLPLTHIFARTLHYSMMWYGAAVYFSEPDRLGEDLRDVKPTFFASVPRVLEKAFERILSAGQALTGVKRTLFDKALDLARRYDAEVEPSGLYALQLGVADRLVLSKWREALGGNVRKVIVGGAALRGDLVNVFGAAGLEVLQGYGLTETSPVITYNRPNHNKPGTVGLPLAGVEVKLSADGEIMTRGSHVMQGYYKLPDKTAEVLDDAGWFRTGDLGSFDEDGFLRITGRVKNLFKLSTGKYVMPQPLEETLESHSLVSTALVTGEGEKFCTALLFLEPEALKSLADTSGQEALTHDAVQAQLKQLVAEANETMPHWSNVKKVALLLDELSIENGLLTPKMSVKRPKVLEAYEDVVTALYGRTDAKAVIVEI